MPDRYALKRDVLPHSYVEHIEALNGRAGDLGEEMGYIDVWHKEIVQDRWETYEMSDCLNDYWFPFGSNGGGEMLCFDLRSGGDAVYWIPYITMKDEDAMLRYDSFKLVSDRIRAAIGLPG